MPSNGNDQLNDLKNRIYNQLTSEVSGGREDNGLLTSNAKIRETATHDFTSYEFLYEPLLSTETNTILSIEEQKLLSDSVRAAIMSGIPYDYEAPPEVHRHGSPDWAKPWNRNEVAGYDDDALTKRIMRGPFQEYVLPLILDALGQVPEMEQESWVSFFATEFNSQLENGFNELVTDEAESYIELEAAIFGGKNMWESIARRAMQNIPASITSAVDLNNRTRTFGSSTFYPFETDTVNFGLQLVYRQVWKPLGTQAGEIIKTIPLGPGQTEKVSIRTLKRTKTERSFSQTTDKETSNETTSSSQDSSEVVDQASSSFRWSTDVKATATWGWGAASASASLGGDKSKSTAETKSNLNESMSKAADKLRVETKVTVKTEATDEFERTQTSEIFNKNDEVAVTYVYSKLQRQYEIHTYLAEVNSVIFVAAPVPSRAEMSPSWFGKNSHIIEPLLMNDTYREDLEIVLAYHQGNAIGMDDNFGKLAEKIVEEGIPNMSRASGTPPDTVTSVLSMYDRDRERAGREREAFYKYERSYNRLCEHISENALHYGRGFWAAKDSDARMLEYRNIRVPTSWVYQEEKVNYQNGDIITPGGYIPALTSVDKMARLSDLVNPAGPVGHAGNYLAFYQRSDADLNSLEDPMALMRVPYLKRWLDIGDSENTEIYAVFAPHASIPNGGIEYTITLSDDVESEIDLNVIVKRSALRSDFTNTRTYSISKVGGYLEVTNLKMILRPKEGEALKAGEEFKIIANTLPSLEDPELRQIKWELGPELFEYGAELFTPELISKMMDMMDPIKNTVNEGLINADELTTWDNLSDDAKASMRRYYPDFILQQRNTRRFLLDTDNVFMTRIVDNASSLEPFKDTHRNLDILRTIEDLVQTEIETQRISERIANNDLSDPDTDTKTVIVSKDSDINVNT